MMLSVATNDEKADPRELFEAARGMQAEAHALEAEAIREALRRNNGLVTPAARALGIHRGSLVNLFKGRHRPLEVEARQLRAKAGYTTGRAPAALYEDGDDG